MEVRVERLGARWTDEGRFLGVGDRAPVRREELGVAAVRRVMSLGVQDVEKLLSGDESRPFTPGPMVGGQSVEGEGIQVDVLVSVRGLAAIRHLGEVAAVLTVTKLALEEVEPGLGGGEGGVLVDPGRREGAEEP